MSKEKILARIGTKTISVDEFIHRAEYTLRPEYARAGHHGDKKIVLNSLIAEKMLALEAGEDNELTRNERFRLFIQGRKEQAMREWFYRTQIYGKVELDPAEVEKTYRLAGRKYQVQYVSLSSDSQAQVIREKLLEGVDFNKIYRDLSQLESVPEREIDYLAPEHPVIQQALFSDTLKVGQIIGPLNIEDDIHLLLRVKSWSHQLALSESEVRRRYQDVEEKLTDMEAAKIFQQYVGKMMQGKKLEFYRDSFVELVKSFAPIYFEAERQQKELLINNVFDEKDSTRAKKLAELDKTIGEYKDAPFFKIDDQVYTVGDFERELQVHPLVFRKQKMRKSEFAEQFKFAIADMIQARYITREAYKKGYDRVSSVQRTVSMWQDALLGLYLKDEYLKNLHPQESDDLHMIQKYLNPYMDQLLAKYRDHIEINISEFDGIELTRIDMVTFQQNVPFPIPVPPFPQLTTNPWLDYGRKMKK